MNVGMLYPLLKGRHVPRAVKVLIYTSILRPISTFGCEVWTLTSAAKSKVQAAEMRVLRLIKGVTSRDRLRNEDIRAELPVKSILQFIEDTQMRWYMRRMTPSRAAQRWWKRKPKTTRPRGRPRKRWMENIKEAVESRGSTLKEIEQSALFQDRGEWRNFVTDRPGLPDLRYNYKVIVSRLLALHRLYVMCVFPLTHTSQ